MDSAQRLSALDLRDFQSPVLPGRSAPRDAEQGMPIAYRAAAFGRVGKHCRASLPRGLEWQYHACGTCRNKGIRCHCGSLPCQS
jgi:hypothetical protein